MNTRNLPLIIGVALPIVFIVAIALVIFIPALFIDPKHDFIYTDESGYYGYGNGYKNVYRVENNRLIAEPTPLKENEIPKRESPTLFLYNIKENTSHQISFDEAKTISIDPGPSSPDGYTVSYLYGHNGIFELFGSDNSNNGIFITKERAKKKLNGITASQGNFKLIGWIQ